MNPIDRHIWNGSEFTGTAHNFGTPAAAEANTPAGCRVQVIRK